MADFEIPVLLLNWNWFLKDTMSEPAPASETLSMNKTSNLAGSNSGTETEGEGNSSS